MCFSSIATILKIPYAQSTNLASIQSDLNFQDLVFLYGELYFKIGQDRITKIREALRIL